MYDKEPAAIIEAAVKTRLGHCWVRFRSVYWWFFFIWSTSHRLRRNTTCEAMGRFNLNVITSLSSLGCTIITRRCKR